jgi:membrane protease YdiL (CAAX protease family)
VAEEQFVSPAGDPIAPEPQSQPRSWNLGDVALITMMFIIPMLILGMFFGNRPMIMLVAQAVSYAISLVCARVIISLKTGKPFFASIEWNYPGAERVPQLLLLGLLLSVAVTFSSSALLPIPKNLPIEKMLQTRMIAIASMTFATVVAPFAEELYFRGIFYGAARAALGEERSRNGLGALLLLLALAAFVLAWRGAGSGYALFAPVLLALGLLLFPLRPGRAALLDDERQTMIAVVLTATVFAFIHGTQLAHSWGPLLAIFIVGLALTIVRVRLRSVAASWLLHTAYNGTLFLIGWVTTSGFRNLR